jgi:hypothetical protein
MQITPLIDADDGHQRAQLLRQLEPSLAERGAIGAIAYDSDYQRPSAFISGFN